MNLFDTMPLPAKPTVTAPDGSDVRVLLGLPGGSMAHFQLAAGATAHAVSHRTVSEIWYIVSGYGEMWRKQGEKEEIIVLEPRICLTIPLGTQFQFRASDTQAVSAIAITLPPWPGDGEAEFISGPWQASLSEKL